MIVLILTVFEAGTTWRHRVTTNNLCVANCYTNEVRVLECPVCTACIFFPATAKNILVSPVISWHFSLNFCTAFSWTLQQLIGCFSHAKSFRMTLTLNRSTCLSCIINNVNVNECVMVCPWVIYSDNLVISLTTCDTSVLDLIDQGNPTWRQSVNISRSEDCLCSERRKMRVLQLLLSFLNQRNWPRNATLHGDNAAR